MFSSGFKIRQNVSTPYVKNNQLIIFALDLTTHACLLYCFAAMMNKYFPYDAKPAVNAYEQGKCLRLIKASFEYIPS